ncbi:NUDIX domain-containing protein [Salinifilum aidingensis]
MGRYSAGILLYSTGAAGTRVLLVHPGGPLWRNRDAHAWSVPKGEYAPGQQAREAALREFAEETGAVLDGTGLLDLGSVRQRGGKAVHVWARAGEFDVDALRSNEFELEWPPRSGRVQRFPEVDRAAWFDLDTAREKINTAQAALLDRLQEALAGQGGGS